MEGKSGINFVLTIVALIFLVAGVALCVLFGIKQTIPNMEYAVELNLYIGLACVGLGLLMLIGCNIATNARITADNTYDTLRHVELLCKRDGISMADLARKDARVARKEANLLEKEQAKAFEVQAQALAQVQAQAFAQASAQAMMDIQSQQPTPVQNAQEPLQAAAAPAQQVTSADADKPLNCGIDYAEWKAKVEAIGVKCGSCGGEMLVRNTKKGIVVLACKNVVAGTCKSTPLPVETMAQQFVTWYNGRFANKLATFDLNVFVNTVASISVTEGQVVFTAK
jgi:hypothetical protein